MRRGKLYSNDELNRAIKEYHDRTKKVIAVTELINFCLKCVEASFLTIIDACEFSGPELYQLVLNTFFHILVSTNLFNIAISGQNREIYNEP